VTEIITLSYLEYILEDFLTMYGGRNPFLI